MSRKRAPMVKVTEEVLEDACAAIASGITLTAFCAEPGRPARGSVNRALLTAGPEWVERFRVAREQGHDIIAERLLTLAQSPTSDLIEVQRRKVEIDATMRLLSKWDTARYGDKVQVDGSGVNITIIAPIVRAAGEDAAAQHAKRITGNGNGHARLTDGRMTRGSDPAD